MTDRDRLIELLENTVYGNVETDDGFVGFEVYCDRIADDLLENGVIVLPCKVGQTVYYISFGKVYKGKCHAITQHKHGLQIHLYDYDGDNAKYPAKKVFLTKEEAEQALKEREQV
jgi:hypothetical protein